MFVGIESNLVNQFLFVCKLWPHRKSTGKVSCIMRFDFSAGIQQKHASFFNGVPVTMIVQGLSVDCCYDGEREIPSGSKGYMVHDRHYLCFGHTRTGHL